MSTTVANRFKWIRCKFDFCRQPYYPDSRHVDLDGRVKDCIPDDNLIILELELEKHERIKSARKRS